MKRYIIKTVDGNRYETVAEEIRYETSGDFPWAYFPTNDGVGVVNININHIVCIIVKEVEE